ncbi:hypothetical protein [Mycolicibacterium thermoresistibile]|uniref:Uncharacterized protein n=2 Tax=Mycolicibacterium thermoresistibile TaxID=1797 RepID=G7CFA5_MYCT3|nr:hypothetical protein [Mycolicibacterium thermoresistibile]EHI13184.1 hypothetical protein KEK_08382 [Mycolicibacterium thermoresistibile ATCC 19527]MCV7187002.1 hypothetical protein [Mycolicibacterium thermoresistibile]GAT13178.1 putative uncharacterized protein [Mycolicibacterium thermoresistibile]SNW20377.1 Uncharacterised protein [Mycolicibacterium thermoresistibile]
MARLDELAIDAAVQGFPMKLAPPEQAVAARRLLDKGVTAAIVAWLIGAPNERWVWRLVEGRSQERAS